jgi:hypothetical protein
MELPIFYYGIKFYKYYFEGLKKPITIEAYNKKEARIKLNQIVDKLPEEYRQRKPYGETITRPLKGISEKTIKGRKYIWVGEKSPNGWFEENELKAKIKEYERSTKRGK